jgi:hypothetical protein
MIRFQDCDAGAAVANLLRERRFARACAAVDRDEESRTFFLARFD